MGGRRREVCKWTRAPGHRGLEKASPSKEHGWDWQPWWDRQPLKACRPLWRASSMLKASLRLVLPGWRKVVFSPSPHLCLQRGQPETGGTEDSESVGSPPQLSPSQENSPVAPNNDSTWLPL